jgi:DNA helicase-4
MDRLPTSITVKPVLLGALFGAKEITLEVKKKGIEVIQGHQKFTIQYEDIGEQVNLNKGILFDDVAFGCHKDKLIAKWLSTSDAADAFQLAANAYYQVIAHDIVKLRNNIKKQLTTYYPRKKHWQKMKDACQAWVGKFKTIPPKDIVTPKQRVAFQFIEKMSLSDNSDLKTLKDEFIAIQLKKYKTYFDTIESNPLTRSQRIACITDEDNNLVIAGAGTGKTSVMIGRAGYLLNAGQAEPKDVLMLAFARKAADEMSERLSEKLNHISIKASTFHSLGQSIVAEVEHGKPSLSKLAEDEKALRHYVDECFQDLMQEAGYRETAINYFIEYLNEEIDPFDYEHIGDHLQALIDNDIRTLKGEKVKSYQESILANFLFEQGIEYQYEAKYEKNTRTIEFRQYQPDFYLPDFGIYIEHYGIDENNQTAPYIDNEKYLESMEWKRKIHQDYDTICIETFHYEYKIGELLSNLKSKLIEAGVELNPLPDEAILATIEERGQLTEFTQLLTDMLKRFKSANLVEADLEDKATNTKNPGRFRAATKLFMPIFHKYEKYLSEHEDIDFDDMINKAITYIKDGKYVPRWKYIMVDEFQDISGPRADLVTEIRNRVANCSLFCVGDDWQAIYRFAGSDLAYTTSFKNVFGTTETTRLDMTFRFNNSINDIASRFVTENPDQLKKAISTQSRVKTPAVSLMRADNKSDKEQLSNVEKVLDSINDEVEGNASVLILGRYNFNLPKRDVLNHLREQFNNLSLNAMTIHASKGKEADYVVLLNLEAGKYGFPSEKTTHPLLEALLPPQQSYSFAEERRLFYVALTRAKDRVYLIADMVNPSTFLVELLNKEYPIELSEFPVSDNQILYQQVSCIRCETGNLVPRTSRHGDFFGCSHYPRCSYTENGCDCCGSLMKRKGRYKLCTDHDCDGWVPTCTVCKSDMALRTSRYGKFWSCKNYRSQGVSCGHKENSIAAPNISDSSLH